MTKDDLIISVSVCLTDLEYGLKNSEEVLTEFLEDLKAYLESEDE